MSNHGMEIQKGRFERTAPLLKQSQVEDMESERDRLSGTLNAPPYLRNAIQDRGSLYATLKRIEASLNRDAPRAYDTESKDKAVAREKELREAIAADMCTQAEMRRAPPGAVDKHLAFEKKHKANIAEWQNIRRRLLASGDLPENLSERSASNIEMFRPAGGSGEMNMDNAQVPQARSFHGLGGRSTPFSDEELAVLKILAPSIYNRLALLSAEDRDELRGAIADEAAAPESGPILIDDIEALRKACTEASLSTFGNRQTLVRRLRDHRAAQAQAQAQQG